jgi:NAD(P)-dependent dehydrogenase (short-subunit alcohol dehydrogenase family)
MQLYNQQRMNGGGWCFVFHGSSTALILSIQSHNLPALFPSSPTPHIRADKTLYLSMTGTVLITGANGSLAIPAVAHLLGNYPDFTAILAVRNAAESDVNTTKLRQVIAQLHGTEASIYQLDLANLSTVHDFASQVASDIAAGKYPPLSAIICNAFYWNLVDDIELTCDGYEKAFQVSTLDNATLSENFGYEDRTCGVVNAPLASCGQLLNNFLL